MEQEEKYGEFIDKYNRIIKENDVHKIKKPENYEELKYTSEEKQNYMIAMLKIYRIFSDEMYKLYTEISKYMSDIKEQEIMYDIKFLRIECICQYSDATIQAFKIQHENNQYNFDGTFNTLTIYKEEILKLKEDAEKHDKKILEMMGIFLTIFSVIGLGFSSILRLESNHIKIWLMLCGAILITMSGLFYLIDPDKFIKQEDPENNNWEKLVNCMKKPITIGIILLIVGGLMKYESLEENKKLVEQEEFEKVKKNVENLSKNLDTKDLKFEIEKLKSKIEELENNKSKNRK